LNIPLLFNLSDLFRLSILIFFVFILISTLIYFFFLKTKISYYTSPITHLLLHTFKSPISNIQIKRYIYSS